MSTRTKVVTKSETEHDCLLAPSVLLNHNLLLTKNTGLVSSPSRRCRTLKCEYAFWMKAKGTDRIGESVHFLELRGKLVEGDT
jgi:hypothetical protein